MCCALYKFCSNSHVIASSYFFILFVNVIRYFYIVCALGCNLVFYI